MGEYPLGSPAESNQAEDQPGHEGGRAVDGLVGTSRRSLKLIVVPMDLEPQDKINRERRVWVAVSSNSGKAFYILGPCSWIPPVLS